MITKTMTELIKFITHAQKRGLDLSGDTKRFYKIKTARAWTAWLAKARGAA